MLRNVAVILAGGTGTRIGLDIPKQLIKIAGKPMIFMVPDLEQYQETSRSSLFAYEPTAPGPLLRTTNEVVAAAGDLPAVRRDYAEAYQTFRAEFLDLDDGHAAERLVDQVFMVEGLGP